MNLTPVLLIGGPRKGRAAPPDSLLDELRRLQERRGEMIAAVGEDGALRGTLGLFPDRDEGGKFYHLAGLQVEPPHLATDVDVFLMEQAGRYLASKKAMRLKFGASPLLTRSAWLYVNRFGARYRWREGTRTPKGEPWPYVSCECDFDDPLGRPLDLRDEEVPARCLVSWEGKTPVRRGDLKFSGPLCVALPEVDPDVLSALAARPGVIATLYDAFQSLHVHGYEFAWFDRLTGPASAGGASRWYYLMKRIVSL
jgi:hypothetical protein